jgi:URI fold toxin 2
MKRDGNKIHGNSNQNEGPHHLYEIWDSLEMEVLKYGISDESIGRDGLSNRIRIQLQTLNIAAGYKRYSASIVLQNLSGKTEAKRIEDECIDAFFEKHGRMPRGNLKRNKKNQS